MTKAKWVNRSRHSGAAEGGARTAKAGCRSEHSRSDWPEGHATGVACNPVSSTLRKIKNWIPAFAGMTAVLLSLAVSWHAIANEEEKPVERTYAVTPPAPAFQTWTDADAKSKGCVSCHTQSDRKTMHASEAVVLGCTYCHG